MTKEELIRSLHLKVGESRYRLRLVELALSKAYDQLVKEISAREDVYELAKSYAIVVLENSELGHNYCKIPVAFVSCKGPQKGVLRIFKKGGETDLSFVPVNPGQISYFNEAEVGDPTGYWVENDIIRFDAAVSTEEDLIASIVRRFEEYDEDEEIPVPGGRTAILSEIAEKILTGKPMKEVNDNSKMTE